MYVLVNIGCFLTGEVVAFEGTLEIDLLLSFFDWVCFKSELLSTASVARAIAQPLFGTVATPTLPRRDGIS